MWNKSAGVGRWLWAVGAGLALTASLPGCLAHARGEVVYGEPVTVVERAPERVYTYPRYEYHGRPAYLVDGRWYYHDDRDRWVVFRDEPRELRDYRVRRAPAHARSHSRYDDGRGSHYQDRRAEAAERRRIDDRRQAERRADARREERREAEHRAAERRADERRAAEHRAAERRADERRANEHRANVRRIEERRDRERRAEGERRVADQKNRETRKKERARRGSRDDDDGPRERRYRND
jgi:hypothetical protein